MDKKVAKRLQETLDNLIENKNVQGLAEFLLLENRSNEMLYMLHAAFRRSVALRFTEGSMLLLDHGVDEKDIGEGTRQLIVDRFNIPLFRRLEKHYQPFITCGGGDNSGPALRYLVMLQTVRAEDHRREMAELKNEITALKKRFEEEIGPKTLDKPKSPESPKKGL